MFEDLKSEMQTAMQAAIESLKNSFSGIRTSRASPQLLDRIKAEVYGVMVPIQQLANISVPEPRMILVEVFDKNAAKPLARAISESSLGIDPSCEGCMIRIHLPELTQERRQELSKVAAKYAEDTKISIRTVRHTALGKIRDLEKNHEISEDDEERAKKDIQKVTDEMIAKVDSMLEVKQKDILQV